MQRFVILGLLAALLGVSFLGSAPAPPRGQDPDEPGLVPVFKGKSKQANTDRVAKAVAPPTRPCPTVYALVYVGRGKSEQANTDRVAQAVHRIADWACLAVNIRDCEVLKLAVIKEKRPAELENWLETNIRVQALEGTSVLRVWFTDGTPEEQAVIINGTLRGYLKEIEREQQRLYKLLEKSKQQDQAAREGVPTRARGVLWQRPDNRTQEAKDAYNSLPRLLEWAAVPGKR